MTYKINEQIIDTIFVMDDNGTGITGLNNSDFTVNIYKDKLSSGLTGTITEVSNGYYNLTFTPDAAGHYEWYIFQATYQPEGWYSGAIVRNNSLDDIQTNLQRVLGLTQENFLLHDPTYSGDNLTGGEIVLYDDASNIGTASGIIAKYKITSTYDSNGRLSTYKVEKV